MQVTAKHHTLTDPPPPPPQTHPSTSNESLCVCGWCLGRFKGKRSTPPTKSERGDKLPIETTLKKHEVSMQQSEYSKQIRGPVQMYRKQTMQSKYANAKQTC